MSVLISTFVTIVTNLSYLFIDQVLNKADRFFQSDLNEWHQDTGAPVFLRLWCARVSFLLLNTKVVCLASKTEDCFWLLFHKSVIYSKLCALPYSCNTSGSKCVIQLNWEISAHTSPPHSLSHGSKRQADITGAALLPHRPGCTTTKSDWFSRCWFIFSNSRSDSSASCNSPWSSRPSGAFGSGASAVILGPYSRQREWLAACLSGRNTV